MLLKIQNENLLPKGGGGDQPSLDHRVFLHFLLTKEKSNMPKYIFKHMIKTFRESQTIKRSWIPYGRLISEILHQGGILNTLKEVNIFTDAQLGRVTGKLINGGTMEHMKLIKKEDYTVLSIDLKEFAVVSNLMEDFPPICKQDPLDVRVHFILEYFEKTGQTIKLNDIPYTMYGGALPIAKSRKSKKRAISKAEYLEDAPELASKKTKKSKGASQEQLTAPEVLSIQQKAQKLDASEVVDKRTRSKKPADASQSSLPQSSIPKKKRKMVIRKLRQASLAEEDQEEVATSLVTREIFKKRAEEAAVKKALEIAAQIAVPSDVLLQEASVEAAQAGIELTENLQQLVVSGELLKDFEEKAVGSEDTTSKTTVSEAVRGNPDSTHSPKVIEIESGTSTSSSTSTSDSSDIDDVPLNKLYKNISPSTKQKQKASDEPYEPLYPSVLDRIGALSQMRVDLCEKLPADHPFQPPIVDCLQSIPADAEGADEPVGPVNTSTSSHPNEPQIVEPLNFAQTETETTKPSEPQQESSTKIPE